ncbi:LysR family transcriptional regulator [Rhizorhapis suberifaciens]|uniref:DNA-binding transcriptional LysR family regulator n=1 Tax=Rhizorhapis suberifaciens TaxID=13656 RepID=A0A840HUP2_9SPHN|nr:LysR family transcriptional regulator [Rhizorhapis suberifaciens]MBB4641663.1 DNA-binding transcriptional LysR family regulator [Rhizorhapis suberifaciens]
MTINLPIELLRSLVAVADAGTMSRAARQISLTQSALSLQMKRLCELTQLQVFNRHSRGVTLTPEGKQLLAYARAILALNDQAVASFAGETLAVPARIGMVQDFADQLLEGVLTRFARLHRTPQLQVRIGYTSELLTLLSGGVLDIVIGLSEPGDPAAVITPRMTWLGHARLLDEPRLPLALMEGPCMFRDAALRALDEGGVPYDIILETASISVLRAALNAGLAISCRAENFATRGLPLLEIAGVSLPHVAVTVRTATALAQPLQRLASFMRDAILAGTEPMWKLEDAAFASG